MKFPKIDFLLVKFLNSKHINSDYEILRYSGNTLLSSRRQFELNSVLYQLHLVRGNPLEPVVKSG